MFKIKLYLLVALSFILVQCSNSNQDSTPEVKNIILLIGDGMGIDHLYAGVIANKSLNMENAQYIGLTKTYSANRLITDSGAAGTAIATGTKTKNGSIGVDENGNALKSIRAHAQENGLSTGLVSVSSITDATPAAFVANQVKRTMREEIAVDFLNSDITLFIGGGRNNFSNRSDERDLLSELEEKGFKVAHDMESVTNTESGKLVGLLTEANMPRYPERGDFLPQSTETALRLLSENNKGFFLMVEGSLIDGGGHSNDLDYVNNEMLDFDNAVKIAFDFADQNPGTLVVVTSDHETGGMSITGGDIKTGEVSATWATSGHSAALVPVMSYGEGAEEFAGIYENTDLFNKMLSLYNFKN